MTSEPPAERLLDVRGQTSGDVFTLTIEGELDLGTAVKVRAPLESAITGGARKVVIDMLGCTFIDSTGLGVLLHSAKRLEGDGGMAIVCLDEQIRRLLGLTMIDRTIPVFSTAEEARAYLGRPALLDG